ncbi:unnamed protein product [Rotaria sp. Silwood1]|nr:unnamed protein product [Rotaria sp. Silwood1]CAF3488313.1 unnamed protein product [Rotaria sp. Silwood1]CAF3491453.1 unnamed protein product [Rotaria sp. Silwood1]CAF3516902.1 unnamed protein product [Rotaria sp. Silwood1]CAF3703779.1 unnamed protein product [Rotaria sp. Silwood1]
MSLPIAATTEKVEEIRAWVEAFFKEYDSLNVQDWVTKYFQPGAILNVGDLPPVKGLKEICDYIEQEHAQVSIIKHDIKHVDLFSDRVYVQKKSTVLVKNDPEQKEIIIKVIFVFWKKINEDKLSSLDVYCDPTSLFERIKMYSSK